VAVVAVAILVAWLAVVAVVTSVVQVSRVARLRLEVVAHRVIVLMLIEVRVETAELQARVETVVDLSLR
jgi:hypothetical protein